MKMFNVIRINLNTKSKTTLSAYPEPHNRACNLLAAQSQYKWAVDMLEEVGQELSEEHVSRLVKKLTYKKGAKI
jgi:hypothetical protein